MLEARYYYNIYLLIVTFATIVESLNYARYSDNRLVQKSTMPAAWFAPLAFTVFMILYIGLRPLSGVFVDMMNYNQFYYIVYGHWFDFDWDVENYLFDNLFNHMASEEIDIRLFFLLLAAIYFGALFIACRKLFPSDTFYAIIIYLAAFSTFSYGTNGIKAGAAATLFLCALAYWRQWIPCIAFLFLSLGFHHSMVLPIVAFLACRFYDKPRAYIWFWVFAFVIAAAHITFFQNLFANFADDQAAGYLSDDDSGYRTGFRLDFIIYSAAPIILGYYYIFKWGYRSKTYNILFNTYTLTNAIWMMCMYASFTNRIAYLSWLMLPIVLVYPLFDKCFLRNQYKFLNTVVWCHLGFTLFMHIIYYGVL